MKLIQRTIASLLTGTMIALAPGLQCYQAAAGVLTSGEGAHFANKPVSLGKTDNVNPGAFTQDSLTSIDPIDAALSAIETIKTDNPDSLTTLPTAGVAAELRTENAVIDDDPQSDMTESPAAPRMFSRMKQAITISKLSIASLWKLGKQVATSKKGDFTERVAGLRQTFENYGLSHTDTSDPSEGFGFGGLRPIPVRTRPGDRANAGKAKNSTPIILVRSSPRNKIPAKPGAIDNLTGKSEIHTSASNAISEYWQANRKTVAKLLALGLTTFLAVATGPLVGTAFAASFPSTTMTTIGTTLWLSSAGAILTGWNVWRKTKFDDINTMPGDGTILAAAATFILTATLGWPGLFAGLVAAHVCVSYYNRKIDDNVTQPGDAQTMLIGIYPAAAAASWLLARALAGVVFAAGSTAVTTHTALIAVLSGWLLAGSLIGNLIAALAEINLKTGRLRDNIMSAGILGMPIAAMAAAGFFMGGIPLTLVMGIASAVGLGVIKYLIIPKIESLSLGELTGVYYPSLLAGIYAASLVSVYLTAGLIYSALTVAGLGILVTMGALFAAYRSGKPIEQFRPHPSEPSRLSKVEEFIAPTNNADKPDVCTNGNCRGENGSYSLGFLKKPGQSLKAFSYSLFRESYDNFSISFSALSNQITGVGAPTINGQYPPNSPLKFQKKVEGEINGQDGKSLKHTYIFTVTPETPVGRYKIHFPGTYQARNDPNWTFSFEIEVRRHR